MPMLILFLFHAQLKQKAGDPAGLSRSTKYLSVRLHYIFNANVFFLINDVI